MKKVILALLVFLSSPFIVSAADVEVTDFLVKAQIEANGDLVVEELIGADGSANWFERDILYKNSKLMDSDYANNSIYNASDITDVYVSAIKGDISYDTFNNNFKYFINGNAKNGDSGKYTVTNITDGYRYRIYNYFQDETVAFYLKYRVKNVVVMHNDVAELYWNFVPDGFQEELNNIKMQVFLPSKDITDNFRIWAHGNLSGEVKKIDNSGVNAEISKVIPGESVDVRLTFNKDLITDITNVKKSNKEALPGILEVEEERANVANNLRENLKKKYDLVVNGSIVMYFVIAILFIFVYFKYGKSPKSTYYSKYNREFIDDYDVPVVDYLMNKKITSNSMSASIMNLIYKKNISVVEIEDGKNKKNYDFYLENMDNINENERILIEFLFDKVGKGRLNSDNKKAFSTIELKKYADGTKTCDVFISSYTKWKNSVLNAGKKENFYVKSKVPVIIGVVVTFITSLIFISAINYEVDFIPAYFIGLIGFVLLIYTLVVDKKTERGVEHYVRWKAFKNFLNDFGTFELKELPEIILWERYLVYATVFGLASKVSKSMNVKISEVDMTAMGYDYYPGFVYINIGNSINNSINNAISTAYSRQSANYANSHSSSSSGSGFGGGFSSGGGFGGGGGGGRFG